ncbi:DNA excision repair protein ERCC-8 [Cunninghamella echinulata]|nr:DNA excision repair protein ERCC-8 [Cunninghamella echinulata]
MSGGSDGMIYIYDLHTSTKNKCTKVSAIANISKKDKHQYLVSSLSWYPFDMMMFLSSSYDGTIGVWDTNTMEMACNFSLESRVYCQSISPIATHCLVASAAAEPHIRLCDLNSGAFTHTLTGHTGEVYSCNWSPNNEFILYSGGNDGTVRIWDIRRANSCIMSLDQDNGVDKDPLGETNIAHRKGVNGLTLSSDGKYLISLGLDEKIRLWDTQTGLNTLVNYGSYFRNQYKTNRQAVISNHHVWPPLLFIPSDDQQVFVFTLLDGLLAKRLKGAYGRVTCVEQRSSFQELYSSSSEGEILIWEAPINDQEESSSGSSGEMFHHDLDLEMDAWSESDDDDNERDL